jgi:hypothetical protein
MPKRLSYAEVRAREKERKRERVVKLRDKRGLTFREIAARVGISLNYTAMLYNGVV